MLEPRRSRWLQRLQKHHQKCEEQYKLEAKKQAQLQHEQTAQLIKMMNRKKEKQEEILDIAQESTDDSLPESSLEMESDYIPSSSPSSEGEEVKSKLKVKKTVDLSAKDAAPQLSQPSESDKDAFNADVFEDTDESDCQTQRPEPSEMTRTKKKGPSKVKRARMTEPTADSDVEESDCQTQRPEPSEMTRTKKKGPSKVKRARMTEPTADSDEEPLCLTQRPEPSETTRTKKKGPSKVKRARMTEPTADSDVEESDCQTQRPEPSEMTRTKKKGPSKVKRARMTEPTADSDVEESDCQTQRPEPSEMTRTKKKGPSKVKRARMTEPTADSDEEPLCLTQRPEPSETTMMKKKGKTKHLTESEVRIRRPWTKTEKAAVQRQLGNFIVLKRVPGKEPCQKALEREPSLQTRTWRDIKNQVYNTITTLKKRQK
ncbi:proteoglycan 4-like isoform X5 [Melanotaenia boesemani]|uniref:proteoglycan 4-like isoform X5 n=1 Tax=Melanotaenia boesemani TaxID=1250792 RepID=UPI001C03D258|nr:proteoglycan 4-like isoform X5 [Melanotaenia boesemani]